MLLLEELCVEYLNRHLNPFMGGKVLSCLCLVLTFGIFIGFYQWSDDLNPNVLILAFPVTFLLSLALEDWWNRQAAYQAVSVMRPKFQEHGYDTSLLHMEGKACCCLGIGILTISTVM
jgi:hypothetical protein